MANNYFRFKEFTIRHDQCAMKVGTDGVLLGSWASVASCKKVLDVGTGSGLIALMLAQRSEAHIDAIDLDRDACMQAQGNVADSPFANRVSIFHRSLHAYAMHATTKYDLIVSNPPYFMDSLKCTDSKRTLARHSDSLTMHDFFCDVQSLLTQQGRVALVLPSQQETALGTLAAQHGFHLLTTTYVKTLPDALPKRILVELCKQYVERPGVDTLVIEEARHQYTPQYIALTKAFYLKM